MIDIATEKSFQERIKAIRSLKQQDLLSPEAQSGISLKDAGPSAFFEYNNKTYLIREIVPYEETSEDFKTPQGYFIYELTCLCLDTGEQVHFEWEFDDELEITMTLDRFSFRHLFDEQGQSIDEDDLDQIADDKDVIVINNEKFWYEDDWAALYRRKNKAEKVYLYEFENESHTKFLTIEEWSGSSRDEHRIYTSVPLPPNEIRMITKGENNG